MKEAPKSRGHVVSNEIVYRSELRHPDLEVAAETSDWFAKYNLGAILLDLNFKFVGQGGTYFNCVIGVAPLPVIGSSDSKSTVRRIDWRDDMLIRDIQFIEYPEQIALVAFPRWYG